MGTVMSHWRALRLGKAKVPKAPKCAKCSRPAWFDFGSGGLLCEHHAARALVSSKQVSSEQTKRL